jgi:hypothetical protein
MTYSRDTTISELTGQLVSTRLTPSEIEEFREDNRRAAAKARELIRAEMRGIEAAEAIIETMRRLEAARDAKK